MTENYKWAYYINQTSKSTYRGMPNVCMDIGEAAIEEDALQIKRYLDDKYPEMIHTIRYCGHGIYDWYVLENGIVKNIGKVM